MKKLSKARQWLIERCQYTNFGSLKFSTCGGEPDLTRPHKVSRTIRLLGGDNSPRPEMASKDFELRREHITLLTQLSHLPDGTCVSVKVAHGLPCVSINVEEEYRPA